MTIKPLLTDCGANAEKYSDRSFNVRRSVRRAEALIFFNTDQQSVDKNFIILQPDATKKVYTELARIR